MMEEGHCVRTLHAETNAVLQAARNGVRIDGATLYVTASCCWPCFKTVVGAGVGRIHCGEIYGGGGVMDPRVVEAAERLGIEMVMGTGGER